MYESQILYNHRLDPSQHFTLNKLVLCLRAPARQAFRRLSDENFRTTPLLHSITLLCVLYDQRINVQAADVQICED